MRACRSRALTIGRLEERLSLRGLQLQTSDAAIDWLAEAGYDPAYGARPVRRAVRQHLLNPLAQLLLAEGEPEEGDEGAIVRVDPPASPGSGLQIQLVQT